MDVFVGPAARTRTFAEVPFGSNIGKDALEDAFGAIMVKIGGGNDKVG